MYSCIKKMLGDDGTLEVCILGCQMFDLAMVERQKANFEMFFFFSKLNFTSALTFFIPEKIKSRNM